MTCLHLREVESPVGRDALRAIPPLSTCGAVSAYGMHSKAALSFPLPSFARSGRASPTARLSPGLGSFAGFLQIVISPEPRFEIK
ncbi:hypothetical protein L596_026664 [Steinernema carpocapsae]|uniref:Uncharacterized protein n=1 Tax=Steinernema carpocapsae TaxID=34508 RepID=A0A4V5ZY87_STECR|nr:hypothetical protein L596_026664 [Steinernema carpocapsae]